MKTIIIAYDHFVCGTVAVVDFQFGFSFTTAMEIHMDGAAS